jgi:hypothetical protein
VCPARRFGSEPEAAEVLKPELERLRRDQRVARSLTLAELAEVYLAQHDVDPATIDKLRWLLGKAVAAFGERPVREPDAAVQIDGVLRRRDRASPARSNGCRQVDTTHSCSWRAANTHFGRC